MRCWYPGRVYVAIPGSRKRLVQRRTYRIVHMNNGHCLRVVCRFDNRSVGTVRPGRGDAVRATSMAWRGHDDENGETLRKRLITRSFLSVMSGDGSDYIGFVPRLYRTRDDAVFTHVRRFTFIVFLLRAMPS